VSEARRDFILRHTRLQRPPHTPELQLHLADEIEPVWRMSEEALGGIGAPPPFWAFAWAGGQALARYLLDNPHEVAGRRVLDVASGSGLVAIAAMKAGARSAVANDLDPYCPPAVALNAEVNGVAVGFLAGDLLDAAPPVGFEVITAGDVCYEKPFSERILAWLHVARASGVRVLIGDPGRSYFPASGLARLADYQVETTRELEDSAVKRAGVWTFAEP
jgi:predicted nicotinamide N-methyase